MTIAEVLHALVDRLPKDWELGPYHQAVDDHFAPAQPATTEKAPEQ